MQFLLQPLRATRWRYLTSMCNFPAQPSALSPAVVLQHQALLRLSGTKARVPQSAELASWDLQMRFQAVKEAPEERLYDF